MSDVANSEISKYKYKSYYKNVENISEDCLTIKDYLWRYDVGYFFTANTLFSNKFFRHYMGDILQSDRISKIGKLLKLPNKDEAIINDLILTPNNFVEFFNWYNKNINVYPVWICPTKCVDTFSFVRCDNSLEIDSISGKSSLPSVSINSILKLYAEDAITLVLDLFIIFNVNCSINRY